MWQQMWTIKPATHIKPAKLWGTKLQSCKSTFLTEVSWVLVFILNETHLFNIFTYFTIILISKQF